MLKDVRGEAPSFLRFLERFLFSRIASLEVLEIGSLRLWRATGKSSICANLARLKPHLQLSLIPKDAIKKQAPMSNLDHPYK